MQSDMSDASLEGGPGLLALQARIRTKQQRDRFRAKAALVVRVQAQCRGALMRRRWLVSRGEDSEVTVVVALQAVARGFIVRRAAAAIRRYLSTSERMTFVVSVQTQVRGYLVRRQLALLRLRLWVAEPDVVALQTRCRQILARRNVRERRHHSAALMSDLVGLQAVVKRLLTLKDLAEQRNEQWIEVVAPTTRRIVDVETASEDEPAVDEIALRLSPPPRPPRFRHSQRVVDETATLSSIGTTGLDRLSQKMVGLLDELEQIEGEVTEYDAMVGMAVWHRVNDKTTKADEAWLRLVMSKANGRAPFEVDEDGKSLPPHPS